MTLNTDSENYWHRRATSEGVFSAQSHFGRIDLPCFIDRFDHVQAMFQHAVDMAGDDEAVVFGDARLSYGQLQDEVKRLAGGLARLGISKGSRMGILTANRTEFVVALLASVRLGAVAVPINVRLQTAEIQYIVEHSGMQALLIDGAGRERYPKTPDESATDLKHIIATEDVWRDRDNKADNPHNCALRHLESYQDILDGSDSLAAVASIDETDPVLLLYTSGTTGKPKGAVITHLGVVHAAQVYAWAMQLGRGERSIMAVPASHITGITANIFAMIGVAGCTVILQQFKAGDFVQTAASEKMTHTVIVPAMYKLCLIRTTLTDFDLSHWRIGGYGGAPMPESTIEQLAEQLPDLGLFNIYGATETTGPVIMMPPGQSAGRGDSIGQILPISDISVVDPQGREVAAGESGELQIRGPNVIAGYWNDEQANKKNFRDGGWCSGDIASIDTHGYVRIVDRLKDVINRGGYKVYSIEVENCLDFHPQVVESAVVARPDDVLGEKTHAHICSSSTTLDEATLRKHCSDRLADYKVPDYFTISDQPLPRNANGKLLKKDLRLISKDSTS